MSKEIFKKFEEMQEKEQIIDFVDTELKETFLEGVLNGSFQGWRYDVLLSTDGLRIAGPFGSGTITMQQYENKAITILSIPSTIEIDTTIVDLDNLDKEDREELIEKIIEEEEFEDEEELYDNLYSINLDGYFQELDREKYDEMVKDHAELLWENYYRDNWLDEIYNNVDMQKEYEEVE